MGNFSGFVNKNIYLFLSQITNPLWSFILSSLVVSLGSVSLYGEFVLLQTYASLVFTIFFSGISQYIMRFSPSISPSQQANFAKNIIGLTFIIFLILLVFCLLISIKFNSYYYLSVLLCSTLIINNLMTSFLNGFLRRRELCVYLFVLLFFKTTSLIFLFFLCDDVDLHVLVITVFVSTSFLIFSRVSGYLWPNFETFSQVRRIFKFSLPYSLTGIIAWAAQSTDKFYLSFFVGNEQLGIYGIHYLLVVTPVTILGQVFHLYSLPEFYNEGRRRSSFIFLLLQCLTFIGALTLVYIIGLFNLSEVVGYFYSGIEELNFALVLCLLFFATSQVLASYAEAIALKYREPAELMNFKLLGYGVKLVLMVLGAWYGGLLLMLNMAVMAHCAIIVGFLHYYRQQQKG